VEYESAEYTQSQDDEDSVRAKKKIRKLKRLSVRNERAARRQNDQLQAEKLKLQKSLEAKRELEEKRRREQAEKETLENASQAQGENMNPSTVLH